MVFVVIKVEAPDKARRVRLQLALADFRYFSRVASSEREPVGEVWCSVTWILLSWKMGGAQLIVIDYSAKFLDNIFLRFHP